MTDGKHNPAALRTDVESTEGPLQRWVQRKRRVAEGTAVPPAPEAAHSHPGLVVQPSELPPLESLTGESDFSAFLSPEVDEALRKAALRKLFHLADFNITDGLNDYDDDYSLFEPLGETVPYQMKRWLGEQVEEGADDCMDAGGTRAGARGRTEQEPESRVKQDARADDCMDAGGRAKQDARAETLEVSLQGAVPEGESTPEPDPESRAS